MKRSPLPPRKTPLKRATTPLKRTAIARNPATPIKRTPIKRKPARDAPAARAFKAAVRARSGGRCEACPRLVATRPVENLITDAAAAKAVAVARRCHGRAEHAHHKAPKGMGGRGDQSPENGVDMCEASHRFVHANPAIGYATGLLAHR